MGGIFGGIGDIVKSSTKILDKFVEDKGESEERKQALIMFESELRSNLEKASIEAEVRIRSEIESSIRIEMESKAKIMEAELKQDDKYVKRARPTIVYSYPFMLLLLLVASISFSAFGIDFNIPDEVEGVLQSFSIAWGGVVGTYVIGRSKEKINDSTSNPTSSNSITGMMSAMFKGK